MSRYLGDDFLLPAIDPNNQGWFTSGALHIQFCNACDKAQHPPEELCRSCQSHDVGFREIVGTGRIESVVTVEHPVHPLLVDRCPYLIAVVSLDGAPGCSAIGNILNVEPGIPKIGDRVRVSYEEATDAQGTKLMIPQWEPV